MTTKTTKTAKPARRARPKKKNGKTPPPPVRAVRETPAPDLDTLLGRMEFVLRHYAWSAREWARQAGLSEESHVGGLMRTLKISGRPLTGDLTTWARLADAAAVSLDWIVFGRGEPFLSGLVIPEETRYPARGLILGASHYLGLSQPVVDAIAAMNSHPTDPGPSFWIEKCLDQQRLIEQRARSRKNGV